MPNTDTGELYSPRSHSPNSAGSSCLSSALELSVDELDLQVIALADRCEKLRSVMRVAANPSTVASFSGQMSNWERGYLTKLTQEFYALTRADETFDTFYHWVSSFDDDHDKLVALIAKMSFEAQRCLDRYLTFFENGREKNQLKNPVAIVQDKPVAGVLASAGRVRFFAAGQLSQYDEETLAFLRWNLEPMKMMFENAESIVDFEESLIGDQYLTVHQDFTNFYLINCLDSLGELRDFFDTAHTALFDKKTSGHDQASAVIKRYQAFEESWRQDLGDDVRGQLKEFIQLAEHVNAMNEQRAVSPPAAMR